MTVGAIIGALISGKMTDGIGRRYVCFSRPFFYKMLTVLSFSTQKTSKDSIIPFYFYWYFEVDILDFGYILHPGMTINNLRQGFISSFFFFFFFFFFFTLQRLYFSFLPPNKGGLGFHAILRVLHGMQLLLILLTNFFFTSSLFNSQS